MFVAIAGENTDGQSFIGEAFRRGALVALVQEVFG
jgi:UDP-N-acetylmuramyl pentapeptide synthase